ncbi:MAG TPA: dockerin type I domain-containing protein [Pirellulales bacterium]
MTSTASGVRSVFVFVVAGHLSMIGLAILISESRAAGLPAGDIVVTADITSGDPGLMLIDPTTGNRTILSDNTHGTGMPFTYPNDVSVMSNGQLLVADGGTPYQSADTPVPVPDSVSTNSLPPATPARLYIVDPTTGNRTVISQDSLTTSSPVYSEIGSGPAFGAAGYARQVGNQILVSAANNNGDLNLAGRLMTVDPATGNRAIFSNFNVGTGPAPEWMGGMVASGNSLFAPGYFQGLFKIDLATGNRILLSGANAGAGPAFTVGYSAAAYGGQIYVSGAGQSSNAATYGVFRIDPVTGNRSVVSSSTVGNGPLDTTGTMQLAIGSAGTILMTVQGHNANGLLTIDPLTGNRALLSDATHGAGPAFEAMNGVTVIPLYGDANGDGIVNTQDLATIASQWSHNGYFLQGDLNNDGIVNAQDLALASSNWLGTSLGHGDLANANTMAPVPEPATVLLSLVAGAALAVARLRSKLISSRVRSPL